MSAGERNGGSGHESDPVLDSSETQAQGLAPAKLQPGAPGGRWLNVVGPGLLRDIAASSSCR